MHRNGGTHLTRIVVHYTPEYPLPQQGQAGKPTNSEVFILI